jgi:hypothetical protein
MKGAKRIDSVIAPVVIEMETPLPQCCRSRHVRVPESQATLDIVVDVEQIVRKGAGHGRIVNVRIEHFSVRKRSRALKMSGSIDAILRDGASVQ